MHFYKRSQFDTLHSCKIKIIMTKVAQAEITLFLDMRSYRKLVLKTKVY